MSAVVPRRLVVLFLLAALAVGAFLALELPRRRAEVRDRSAAAQLFAFDPGTVDAIELERADGPVRFALAGTHWTMTAPLADDAEAGTVAPIVSALASARIVRDLGRAERPERFGLTHPTTTIRLLAAGDTVAVLELGDHAVDRSAVYARRPGGPVLLVPTSIHRAVTLPLDDYRNRRVLVFDLAAVHAFTIASRLTGESHWTRAGGERWFTVIAGDTVRGDSVAVPAVLRRLRGMRVRTFAGADTTAAPLLGVTLHKLDGSSQAVRFFLGGDSLWVARVRGNPRTVLVADDPTDIAHAAVATLRDRRLLHFDPAAARRITVATPDTSAVLVRAGDRWALPNPALGVVDREHAADFVRALRTLRYARLRADAPDPRAAAVFSLVIYDGGDTILDALYCAPAPAGAAWIARSHSLDGVCEIDGDALATIMARLSRVRR